MGTHFWQKDIETATRSDIKKMQEQIEFLANRVESMEKEMYEIRKGNTQGNY